MTLFKESHCISRNRNFSYKKIKRTGFALYDVENYEEALFVFERMQKAADMNLDDTWMHGQYDLKYSLSPYARERMEKPFKRIDNRDPD